jgi:hypothetical protein
VLLAACAALARLNAIYLFRGSLYVEPSRGPSKVNATITRQLGMREVVILAIAGVLIGIMVVVLFACVLP